MMEDALFNLQLIEELEMEELNVLNMGHRFQTRENPFTYSDIKFIKLFRLNKLVARNLIQELSEFMPLPTRSSALYIQTKVLVALRFYAVGEYQTGVGISTFCRFSQASVSRCITEVSTAMNQIMHRWVKFPDNLIGQAEIMRGFNNNFRFPGVLGVIDCTHVAIVAPPVNDPDYAEHYYVNRKGYHSINVQLTCDANMRILHVNALYPGSCSDKFIFRESNLKRFLENRYNQHPNNHSYLLGDSGYSVEAWMMTIDNNAIPGTPEAIYNERQKLVRCTIERCNGLLKQRFRCCLKHRVLHYHPEAATKIINACVILHNMCIEHGIEVDAEEAADNEEASDEDEEELNVDGQGHHMRRNPLLIAGERIRTRLIQRHFT